MLGPVGPVAPTGPAGPVGPVGPVGPPKTTVGGNGLQQQFLFCILKKLDILPLLEQIPIGKMPKYCSSTIYVEQK